MIRHTPTGGPFCFARYAHVENIIVSEGQRVKRGQQIASVGNANGAQPYHRIFDISFDGHPVLQCGALARPESGGTEGTLRRSIGVSSGTDPLIPTSAPDFPCTRPTSCGCGRCPRLPAARSPCSQRTRPSMSWAQRELGTSAAGGYLSRRYTAPYSNAHAATDADCGVRRCDGRTERAQRPGTNHAIITTLGNALVADRHRA